MCMTSAPDPDVTLRTLLPQPECCQTLWNALACDPVTGVQVVREDGLLLFMNRQAAELFFGQGTSPEEHVGRNVRDYVQPGIIEERLAFLHAIAAEGRSRTVRSVYHGKQLLSTAHPFQATIGTTETFFLVITHHVEGDVRPMMQRAGERPLLEARANQLGALSTLSPRELEVLALIAEGLSLPEISRRLHRSVHTINDHRKAIGRKLGVDDRVRLAELARAAGLTTEDARRPRIPRSD